MPRGVALESCLTAADSEVLAVEKLALVIPTLCEADNICRLLTHVRSVLDPLGTPYEILVVDDDSCDGTSEMVAAVAESDPRVRLFVRKGERGLSGAILYGWQRTDATVLGELVDLDTLRLAAFGREDHLKCTGTLDD